MKKYYYTYDKYRSDVKILKDKISASENPHLVSIYRGSLPIGVHVSNLLNIPLSILKFQSYEEKNDKDVKILYNDGICITDTLVILDDIYDTGKTIRKVKEFLGKEFPYTKMVFITLFGKQNNDNVIYINEHPGCWIVFPWETIN